VEEVVALGRTEKQKMLAGELYSPTDPELLAERRRCEALVRSFNAEPDEERRTSILGELLGSVGPRAVVMPPFACDYGYNVSLGAGAFVNYQTVILDCAPVSIGEQTQIGPGVQLLACDHPTDPALRRVDLELAFPIVVGVNVWIGGGAIVCPGVSIGDDSVIGAGSVVIRDIPAGVVAVGIPCRVVRSL
jgi:maltose O-acetyltransferase